jgi:hypothetical protein
MKRTLSLRRETLSDLTAAELGSVAGGANHTIPSPECVTEILRQDLTREVTQYLPVVSLTDKCV